MQGGGGESQTAQRSNEGHDALLRHDAWVALAVVPSIDSTLTLWHGADNLNLSQVKIVGVHSFLHQNNVPCV